MARLAKLGPATVYEAHARPARSTPPSSRWNPRMTVAGRAVTVRLERRDNWFIHAALLGPAKAMFSWSMSAGSSRPDPGGTC